MNLRTKAGRPAKKEAPPPLGTRQLTYEEWLDAYGLEKDVEKCEFCKGTGEVEHDCDCEFCELDVAECEECNGAGEWDKTLERYKEQKEADAERWRQFSGRYSPSTPVAA